MPIKKDDTPVVSIFDVTMGHAEHTWSETSVLGSAGMVVDEKDCNKAEWQLLENQSQQEVSDLIEVHDLTNAPLFTRGAYARNPSNICTQYGVLGKVTSCHAKSSVYHFNDPRLYLNTNAPFSAVVCGVQGSGKSHTVSVMLENMFLVDCPSVGSLQKPLCGLVLHFGEGGAGSSPCEAAWVGITDNKTVKPPPVTVYVSKSSLNRMRSIYAPLMERGNVTVEPLSFNESELDAQAFLSMMAVGSSENAPLYIQIILSILRDLGESFTYQVFMRELEKKKKNFNPSQMTGLEQRMSLLNSFMAGKKSGFGALPKRSRFRAGELTIIDLSDPFIDPLSACGLFEVITRLFVRAEVGTGKVLVVDEAHKYLSAKNGSSGLTSALLSLTRQQRHLAMRVIISTQEPTVVPPVVLDLCTVAILHRFSSPSWWAHLEKHVSADFSNSEAFDRVVKLQTGEAIVLAPSGLGVFPPTKDLNDGALRRWNIAHFGRKYILIKTRKRLTVDGGASVLVLESNA